MTNDIKITRIPITQFKPECGVKFFPWGRETHRLITREELEEEFPSKPERIES